jgi:hypothetical protein
MIVDLRIYTARPGTIGALFKLYETEGYAIQTKYLGKPLGYYVSDIGPQNRVVHLWGYPDIAERARRRAAMEQDPEWLSYRAKSTEFFHNQENRILRHAPFHPARTGTTKPFGIVDFRVYHTYPGKLGALLNAYEYDALPLQMKYLGNNVGWYQSDIGTQHEVVHLWGYDDIADRQARRNAMLADPAWGAYLAKGSGLLRHMENWILRPAPFWKPGA